MSVTLLRNPPADNSGGFISVRLTQSGRIVSIGRFHVVPFGAGGAYTTPPGTETTVAQTFAALLPFLEPLWDSAWDIALTALTQRTGGTLQRVAVPTGVGGVYLHHNGTGAPTSGIEGYVEQNLMFHTANPGRISRVRLIGQGGVDPAADGPVAADAAGTNLEKLVAYLTGANTGIVAHDGTKLTTPVHQTTTLAARPRRFSMRVA